MIPLANKVVWVTGASSGIGAGLAVAFAEMGYTVAVSARRGDALETLARTTHGNGRILPYPLDTTDTKGVRETLARIMSDLGRVDLAILNAGVYVPDDTENLDLQAITDHFNVNVVGTMNCLIGLVPLMENKPGAHIAITSSVAGYRGLPRGVGYGGSKAALISIAEGMKLDLDRRGIKLQIICPGFVETRLTEKNTFPMPFLIDVDQSVKAILRGLQSDRFEIVFPARMAIVMKIFRALPYALFFPVLRKMMGVIKAPSTQGLKNR